jgi:hypothetical protein
MAAGVAAAALLALALGVAVDPYRVFGTPPIPGWTQHKTRIYQHAQPAKRWMIGRVAPRTLLLGNSRVEAGLDPDTAAWPEAVRPVFNAALAGRRLDAAVQMMRAGLAAGRLTAVVVGLDFVDFLPRADLGLLPGAEAPPRDRRREAEDLARATLAFDAPVDALLTLLGQRVVATDMTERGFNPMRDYAAEIARNGAQALFAEKREALQPQMRRLRPRDFADTAQGEFAALRQLLREANAAGLDVTLFIHPHHLAYLEELRAHGFWDAFEAWKRALVAVVAEAAPDARLIDFSIPDEATAEPVPPPGRRGNPMRYHWELGHYTAAMGDRILPTLLGDDGPGRRLNAGSLEATLREIRAALPPAP